MDLKGMWVNKCMKGKSIGVFICFGIFSLTYIYLYFVNGANGLLRSMISSDWDYNKLLVPGSDKHFGIPEVKVTAPSCTSIFNGSIKALEQALVYQTKTDMQIMRPNNDDDMFHMAKDCKRFIAERQYIMSAVVTDEEKAFPLAFSLMIYKDVDQAERLLRAIYRPQNYYCVHVDGKSHSGVKRAMFAIAGCLPNVFISSRSIDVEWGTYSVLEPQFVCMEDLWRFNDWRYFFNLAGQEFPLRTNLELVHICKALNGTNNICSTMTKAWRQRTQYVYHGLTRTNEKKDPPPVNVTLGKGYYLITASRAYVDYVLHDSRALKFREWVKDTGIPDETFFQSLNVSPQLEVPGARTGPVGANDPAYFTRYDVWGRRSCRGGKIVRGICIFGVKDLPHIVTSKKLFVNKFHRNYQPLAYDCLEEWYFDRVRDQTNNLSLKV